MSLTPDEYQSLILANIGDDGTIAPYMPNLWEKNEGYSLTSIQLQYLHAWRDSISLLMGQIWRDVTVRMPTRAQLSLREKFSNLKAMQVYVDSLIVEYYMSGGAEVSDMETVVTLPGNPGYPDPNSGIYRGDTTAVQSYYRVPW